MNRTAYSLICGLFAVAFAPGCRSPGPMIKPPVMVETKIDYADPILNQRQILLIGSIDERSAEKVLQKLLYLDGKSKDPIDLFLQTPGGDIKSAASIERMMKFIQSPVNTYALSECNSGGAYVLAAGTGKRRAFGNSVIMLHGLDVRGTPPPGLVEMFQDNYTRFWRERTRLPADWLPLPFASFRVLSADEALKYGVIDEIVDKK